MAKSLLSFIELLPLIFWDHYPKNSTKIHLRENGSPRRRPAKRDHLLLRRFLPPAFTPRRAAKRETATIERRISTVTATPIP